MEERTVGRFVTVDGPSAVGKTTACHSVAEVLRARGIDTMTTATPSASDIGRLARHGTFRLSGHALSCLVAADRYDHRAHVVEPALHGGRTVLCDRYVPSAFVLDTLDGVDRAYVSGLYEALPAPDVAIILAGDVERCAARARARDTSYSRFHSIDRQHRGQEHALFDEAFGLLATMGYPVHRVEIGVDDPMSVAVRIADIITRAEEKAK